MKSLLLLSAIVLLAAVNSAHASQILNCAMGDRQGSAQIEVLRVENHPEFSLLKVDLGIVPVKEGVASRPGIVHLQGLLAARSSHLGIFASGLVSVYDDGPIINPESITLQGSTLPDGSLQLELLDENRVLQHGYGLPLLCRGI